MTEREMIIAAYALQAKEAVSGKGGFHIRDVGFVSLARARRETGVSLKKSRPKRPRQLAWGDFAIIKMLNQPRGKK